MGARLAAATVLCAAALVLPGGAQGFVQETWWAYATGHVCVPPVLDSNRMPTNATTLLTADATTYPVQQQPAAICGLVLNPPTNASGFVFLQRVGPDSVAFNISVYNWAPNNTIKSVHVHAGGPGQAYPNGQGGGVVVEFVGSLVVANTGIPGRQLIHSGTFSSTDLVGVLAGQTIDQFFAMLRGEQMTQIGGLNLPLLGGYSAFHSTHHPVWAELRGDLYPAQFSL